MSLYIWISKMKEVNNAYFKTLKCSNYCNDIRHINNNTMHSYAPLTLTISLSFFQYWKFANVVSFCVCCIQRHTSVMKINTINKCKFETTYADAEIKIVRIASFLFYASSCDWSLRNTVTVIFFKLSISVDED